MDERAQRAIDRMQAMNQKLADEQADRAIGQAAVTLHQQGQPVTTQALVSVLLDAVRDHQPDHLRRMQHEAAARLLGWEPSRPEGPAT